jgi:hypothetical protein
MGPAGPAGPQGEPGAPGAAGAGIASFEDLGGLPCREGTEQAGTIRVVYGPGGVASLRCQAGEPVTLTVATAGDGQGIVVSDPPGIDCGTDCDESYNAGTRVTLRAIPTAEDRFARWTGACTGTAETCTVEMSAAASVTAEFADYQPVTIAFTLERSQTPRPGGGPESVRVLHDQTEVCSLVEAGSATCRLAVPTGEEVFLSVDAGAADPRIEWRGCERPPEHTPSSVCYLTMTEPASVQLTVR